jgi:hypothetical protein
LSPVMMLGMYVVTGIGRMMSRRTNERTTGRFVPFSFVS